MAEDPHRRFTRSAEELISDFLSVPHEPTRGRKRPTQNLMGLMEQLIVKHRIAPEAPEHKVRAEWAAIVGPANAQYSHPAEIDERGRLSILTTHAVVRNELFHHRALILEKIRKLPGCAHVRELQLRSS